jgi:hypothetical protein
MTRCYAWPLTIRAGADLQLYVSTPFPEFGVRLFRIDAAVEEIAIPAGRYQGQDLPFGRPDDAWAWPRYSVGSTGTIAAGNGLLTRPDACLFVLRRRVPMPGRGKIIHMLPTATYAAYNQLGGVSQYADANWVRDCPRRVTSSACSGRVTAASRPGDDRRRAPGAQSAHPPAATGPDSAARPTR